MATKTAHASWIEAQGTLKLAQSKAGIAQAMEQLNARNAFITNEEKQKADERAIVFSVPDRELRCQVIYAHRECNRRFKQSEVETLGEFRKRVRDGPSRIRVKSMWANALAAGVTVFVVYEYGGMKWALAVAVAMLLFGFSEILSAERRANEELETATAELREQENFVRELTSDDDWYSSSEEKTGYPDATA